MAQSNNNTPPPLARVLGRVHLLALGVGAIIGAGIFVVPGLAAARFAGPALVFSVLGSAVACALAGLCYAELAALFPVAGSAYSYTSKVFGRLPGWIIGWLLVLEYLFAAAILAEGWSGYFTSLLATPYLSRHRRPATRNGTCPSVFSDCSLSVLCYSFLSFWCSPALPTTGLSTCPSRRPWLSPLLRRTWFGCSKSSERVLRRKEPDRERRFRRMKRTPRRAK